jgi:hypothetical protein
MKKRIVFLITLVIITIAMSILLIASVNGAKFENPIVHATLTQMNDEALLSAIDSLYGKLTNQPNWQQRTTITNTINMYELELIRRQLHGSNSKE